MAHWIKFPVGASAKFKILFTNPEGKEKDWEGKKYMQYNYCVEIVENNGLDLKENTSQYSYWSTSQKNNNVIVHSSVKQGDIIKVTRSEMKAYIIQDANGDILTDIPKPEKPEKPQEQQVQTSYNQSQTPATDYVEKKVVVEDKPRDFTMVYALSLREIQNAHKMTNFSIDIDDTAWGNRVNSMFIALNAVWSGKYLVPQSEIERMWLGEPEVEVAEPKITSTPLFPCKVCKNNFEKSALVDGVCNQCGDDLPF